MKSKHDTARSALMIIICILIIGSTSVLFISQMNGMVQNNIMNTISELAEHDLVSIQNFVETKWNDLYNIHKCLEVYDCDTILEIQERMNLERATSDFHTIYLVAEDGTVYTDRYMVYPKEKMDIYKYLHLDKLDCCVAIIKNAKSNKMGKKDIMKIECPIDFIDLDILGFIDHNITINIIQDSQIVDKKRLHLPKEIVNVIRCKNPRCITSIEQELDHIFVLTDKENEIYRCKYCEEKYDGR